MAVTFVTGKLGGGKTMFALSEIVDELRRFDPVDFKNGGAGGRYVVTNIPLNLPDMAQLLHDRYGDTFNLKGRVRILIDDEDHCETKEFFLHPSPGLDIKNRSLQAQRGGKPARELPDYSVRKDMWPTLFVLDELPQYFNAREWQQTGDDTIHYLAVSRKVGDDIIGLSQQIAMVDKQFRGFGHQFVVTRNLGYQKIGPFNLPSRLKVDTYFTEPSAVGSSPASTVFRQIDTKFLGKMYNTAGGAGVNFSKADTGRKKTGIPWQAGVIGFAIFVAAILLLPQAIGGAMKSMFGAKAKRPQVTPQNEVGYDWTNKPNIYQHNPNTLGGQELLEAPTNSVQAPLTITGTNWHPTLRMTGYWSLPGVPATVQLSDGRRIKAGDPRLLLLLPEYVLLNIDGGFWFVPQGTPPNLTAQAYVEQRNGKL